MVINKLINVIFLILSFIFLILALIGLALPIVPQVPFFVLSLFFAANGSKRFKKWLKKHKFYQEYFFPIVKQYKFLCELLDEEWNPDEKEMWKNYKKQKKER